MQTDIGGKKVKVGGIAKGSGMIHPNMATLLSVITTDAKVDPGLWHEILLHGVQKSFNQVCFASHSFASSIDSLDAKLHESCTKAMSHQMLHTLIA